MKDFLVTVKRNITHTHVIRIAGAASKTEAKKMAVKQAAELPMSVATITISRQWVAVHAEDAP